MEGGVMISRSYGSVEPFDRAVKQLRQHFQLLLRPQKPAPATLKKPKPKRQPKPSAR
jgi:rRNA processing protein Gar1